jgi:uncharacterized protein YndB with AHSA1/START domain
MDSTNTVDRSFTITRILDAPRALVFLAWTDPHHLGQWYYNDEQPIPTDPITVDLRVGGAWRVKVVIDEQNQYFTGGIYREIVPGEKLVFTWGAVGGWPAIDADHPEADAPVATITFNEVGNHGEQTEMIFHMSLPEHLSEEQVRAWFATGYREGWTWGIDWLVARYRNFIPNH